MGRILLFVVVVAGLAYLVLSRVNLAQKTDPGPVPTRVIEQARESSKEIEADAQRRADEMLRKTE